MNGKNTLILGFLGDLAFNGRWAAPAAKEGDRRLREARAFFRDADLVVGNLECALEGAGTARERGIRVETTETGLQGLMHLGVGAVNLANNHVFDRGREGFQALAGWLDARGIARFGAGETREEAERPAVVEVRGLKVGLLGFCAPETHPHLPPGLHLNRLDPERAVEAAARLARRVDAVVVNLHWGAEWCSLPSPAQRETARRLAGAGARVIAGHHGHMLQGWEKMHGCAVFYGLGNAAFDHVQRDGRTVLRQSAPTRECGLVKVYLRKREPRVKAVVGWSDPEEGIRLAPEWAAASRLAGLSRRITRPALGLRYTLHRAARTATMKYWHHYLRTLGPGACLRKAWAALLRTRKDGPVILFGAGRGGGYAVRYRRLLKNLEVVRRHRPGTSFLLVVPEGDALAREAPPEGVTLCPLSFPWKGAALRLAWIHLALPLLAWWKRAPAVVGLNGFGPCFAPCERIVFVNNARPLSPLFERLPGLPARTRRYVRVQRRLMGIGLRRAARIGVQREGIAREIRAQWKIPAERIFVVPNSTSTPAEKESAAGTESRPGARIRAKRPGRCVFLCPTLYARHKNLERFTSVQQIMVFTSHLIMV